MNLAVSADALADGISNKTSFAPGTIKAIDKLFQRRYSQGFCRALVNCKLVSTSVARALFTLVGKEHARAGLANQDFLATHMRADMALWTDGVVIV